MIGNRKILLFPYCSKVYVGKVDAMKITGFRLSNPNYYLFVTLALLKTLDTDI